MTDIESQISTDRHRGEVVWRMSPEIARFYAIKLHATRGNDAGMKQDAEALRAAADRIDPTDG